MKRFLFFLFVPALVAAFALTSDTSYSAGPPDKVLPGYLALGDSLAAGVGASDPATTGYVPVFRDFLESEDGLDAKVFLNNLGHGGDTSKTLIDHDHLADAVAELEDRNGDNKPNNDVEVVTVNIGGNDVFALVGVCAGGFSGACIDAVTSTFGAFFVNFDIILDELRTAAGPDTTIIVMTQYNPLVPPCPFAPLAALGDVVLEGGGPLTDGLNDLIRSIAASHGAEVAETFGELSAGDLVGDCLHANDDGYALIAGEFENAFKDQ